MGDGAARGTGWKRSLVAVALIVAAGVVAAHFLRAPEQPTAPPPAAAPRRRPTEAADATPPFASWLRREPDDVAARPALGHYFIDALLGHQVFRMPPRGLHPQLARQLLLDDDRLLLSSGRRLWNREIEHQPGLVGEFCYVHSSYCLKRLFEVSFAVDGLPVVLYDNQYVIERFPSHTRVRYQLPGVVVDERKFITYDDRAVAAYEAQTSGAEPHELTIEVFGTYPPLPRGGSPPRFPLLGSGAFQNVPLFLYLDAPGFDVLDTQTFHLRRTLRLEPNGADPKRASVSIAFENSERTAGESTPDEADPDRHAREYNRWFAEQVPYFDSSDEAFKKMWYYRWWIVRFHLVEAETPDLSGTFFYEGKLGFDNVIGFAVPAQLKELTYLRDPRFGLSQARNSYRNRAANGAVVDPPGSPYWGETYSHWIGSALAEFDRVHPIDRDTLRALLPAMAEDVRAWLTAYDRDGDALPERDRPRVTGYDLDILSYWYFNDTRLDMRREPPALERVDFASFVYANAAAVAELAERAEEPALAEEFRSTSERVRDAALAHLWDEQDGFFYPQRASDDRRIPIRELHGLFPFTTRMAPDEPRYVAALAALVDPSEFWSSFPPVITSLRHYRTWTWEMDGLTRNIAPHPISMGARTLLQGLKHYHQQAIRPEHFLQLMKRYNDLVYPGVHPSDPLWRPNVHEYYSEWEPFSRSVRPKPSEISHDFHSMYCSLIVEGAVGLTPRSDEVIELQPLALSWEFFMLDRLRYHRHDLTIAWDRPDGTVRYRGVPEGFSLYVDGEHAFTHATLAHLRYDLGSRTLEVVGEP